jgi:hypothetical protein
MEEDLQILNMEYLSNHCTVRDVGGGNYWKTQRKSQVWLCSAQLVTHLYHYYASASTDCSGDEKLVLLSSFRYKYQYIDTDIQLTHTPFQNIKPIISMYICIRIFPLAPMGVLALGSAHARPSARPPINTSGNFPACVSAESPSNISPNPSEVISEVIPPLTPKYMIVQGVGGSPTFFLLES